MTYPLIGNYGICYEDMDEYRPWLTHLLSGHPCIPSGTSVQDTIQNFLLKYDIPGIAGIFRQQPYDIFREKGTMNGCITTDEHYQIDEYFPN